MAYEGKGREELEALLEERRIMLEPGSGSGARGAVLVPDMIAALEAHDAAREELDRNARIWPARCLRKFRGRAIGSTVLVTRAELDYFTKERRPPHLESLGPPVLEEPEEPEEPEATD